MKSVLIREIRVPFAMVCDDSICVDLRYLRFLRLGSRGGATPNKSALRGNLSVIHSGSRCYLERTY